MRKFYLLTFCCIITFSLFAETRVERDSLRHQVRIGWGDQLFESLIWQVTDPVYVYPKTSELDPADIRQSRNEGYRYTQHWFGEYQYRFTRCFSLGFLFDGSGVNWQTVTRDGYGNALSTSSRHYFYNLVMMPTINFTFLNRKYVSLYAGFGVGLNVNGGTETTIDGIKTVCVFAAKFTPIGLSVNYKRWFWNAEYGGLYSMKGQNDVYLLKSSMFTFSFGVRL